MIREREIRAQAGGWPDARGLRGRAERVLAVWLGAAGRGRSLGSVCGEWGVCRREGLYLRRGRGLVERQQRGARTDCSALEHGGVGRDLGAQRYTAAAREDITH